MPRPKSPNGHRIGLVNPTTLVGNEIKSILRERSFPFFKLSLLATQKEEAGALTEVNDEPAVVASVEQEGLDDLDLVFFCGSPTANREWIDRYRDDRFIAIDLSQPSGSEEGRLAVAGMNLGELSSDDTLLISPHPIALPIALILSHVARVSPVELCAASVVQPASEFGQEAVEELARQVVDVLNVQGIKKGIFDRQLAFNLYPAPEGNEPFIVNQVRSLVGPRTTMALHVTQGTTFHSHTFSLFIRTKDPVEATQLSAALKADPVFAFAEGDQQFGTVDAAGKDEILIAELRSDPGVPNGFWIWAVCDNLRRSSALNAVLVAEAVLFADTAAN